MSESVLTTAHPASPRVRPRLRSAATARRRLLRGGLILGGVLVLGGLVSAPAWWKRVFPGTADHGAVHIVRRGTLSVTLKEEGELKPVKSEELKCEVQSQGVKIEWVIDESTRVSKGDELMRLSADELKDRVEQEEIELRKMAASVEEAEENLKLTLSDNATRLRKAEVDLEVAILEQERYEKAEKERTKKGAGIEIKQAEMNLARKTDELNKSRPLAMRGFVTPVKIKELEDEVERLTMALERARLELRILTDYEFKKNEKQKSTAVAQADEELDREKQRATSREKQAEAKVVDQKGLFDVRQRRFQRLKEQVEKCTLTAPVDGIVMYGEAGEERYWGRRIGVGEQVFQGQTLLTIPDTSQMLVKTRIHEADRHRVSEGMTCVARVPAVPDHSFSGTLTKITQFADSENRWLNPNLKEHTAEIKLDDSDAPLSPGESAQVEILIEEVPDVLTVPVQCVFTRGPKHFVFVQGTVSAKPVEVQTGRGSTTMIELSQGVKDGDRVLLAPDERLLALLPTPTSQPAKGGSPPPQATRPPGGPGRR